MFNINHIQCQTQCLTCFPELLCEEPTAPPTFDPNSLNETVIQAVPGEWSDGDYFLVICPPGHYMFNTTYDSAYRICRGNTWTWNAAGTNYTCIRKDICDNTINIVGYAVFYCTSSQTSDKPIVLILLPRDKVTVTVKEKHVDLKQLNVSRKCYSAITG